MSPGDGGVVASTKPEITGIAKSLSDNALAIFVLIAGAIITIVAQQVPLETIAILWFVVLLVVVALAWFRLREKCLDLESKLEKRTRIDDLFLTRLFDERVVQGQDLLCENGIARGLMSGFENKEKIEMLAFSEDKFNLALMDEFNYKRYDENAKLGKTLPVNAEVFYDHVTFVKRRLEIPHDGAWYFMTQPDRPEEKKTIVVNLLISRWK